MSRKRASTNFPRWTYAASKGAINILTKNMALDLAKYRIRVNSVSPGWIWSPEVAKVIFKISTDQTTLTTLTTLWSPEVAKVSFLKPSIIDQTTLTTLVNVSAFKTDDTKPVALK